MDVVGHTRSVDKDAAVSSEDKPLAKGFTLRVTLNKLVAKLLHNDHVRVDYRQYEAQVLHTAIPLSALVLRQDCFHEVAGTSCSISEPEPLKDSRVTFTHAPISLVRDHVDVSFSAWVCS